MAGQYQEDVDFVEEFCDTYGLDSNTANVFREEKLHDLSKLIALTSTDINGLKISSGQKALLRGALLQYKQNDLEAQVTRAKKTNSSKAKELAKVVKTFEVVKGKLVNYNS